MNSFLKTISMWAYLSGAVVSVVALLALPVTQSTDLWEINILIAMVAVGTVLATAVISAAGLVSKNFPIHFLLVLGTALLVSTVALLESQSPILILVQQLSIGLLILFVACRLVIEFVINKPKAH
jgi:hypothetical protein